MARPRTILWIDDEIETLDSQVLFLEQQGFAKLFGPGTNTEDIANYIKAEMQRRWTTAGERR